MKGIDKAVELAGSQRRLALQLNVSQQAIGEWVKRGFVPDGRVDDVLNAVDKTCEHILPRELLDPELVALVDRLKASDR